MELAAGASSSFCLDPGPTNRMLWARLMAFTIDLVILNCLYCGSLVLVGISVQRSFFLDFHALLNLTLGGLLLVLTLPLCLSTAYFVVFHACGGQTIGKMFMGLRVRSRGSEFLSFGVSFLRFIGLLLSALPIGAGFLWAILDRNQETWHDKLALTEVVDERNFLTRE
ncbi:MAG: RDD family protein [Thermodesulfobacteriota bacterium]|nr:RDD family protein [Thermodesulfobacteriota bacterium]